MGKCNYVHHDKKKNKNKLNIFTKEKILFFGVKRKMII